MLFFYLFIFTSLVLGTFTVGPFSIRVYFTVAMLLYLLIMGRGDIRDKNKIPFHIIWLYSFFIILTGLSLYMNGEIIKSEFAKHILSWYLNCYVTFFAFNHFVKTPRQLKGTLYFLVLMVALNCVVTILQYLGNPFGIGIALALINDPEVQADILSGQNFGSNTFGKDLTIGIFNYSFINGNYIAIAGMLLLGLWGITKFKGLKLVLSLVYILFVVATFVTQSRTPFFLLLFFSLFIFIKDSIKQKGGLIIALLFMSILAIIIPLVLDSLDFGRLLDSDKYDNDPRLIIWGVCLEFLSDHLLWGGPVAFNNRYDVAPHNFFLGAFILSGLFGGLLASFIYLRVLLDSIIRFIHRCSILLSATSAALIIYSIGSLFHNASLINGDTMFFVVYCIFQKSYIFEKNFKNR